MLFNSILKRTFLAICFFSIANGLLAIGPANPNMSPEAKALLDLYYRISGKYTLTGQHNYPSTRDRNSKFAAKYIGKTPVIWSADMGFAKEGDKDSYLSRPDIVKEAIRQHKKGSIITICWHAVPPTANEPITFQPVRGKIVSPDSLASVQGKMLEEQYKEMLTPGTRLYKKWAAQVDTIAVYLKKLQEAKVPVLWRPYHEMNGDWFWWGGRVGQNSTSDIYRQIFDRLVNYHKLNNLIWVWNVDRPSTPIRKFSNFYPGDKYLDIASLDVYGSDFNQAYYDSLMVLAKGKPILFGEVGNPPSLEVLEKQPHWGSWVIWSGFVRNTSKKQFQEFVDSKRMLFMEDPAYWEVVASYRKVCGLAPLPLKEKYPVNFSGTWLLNEEKSESNGKAGLLGGSAFYKMIVDQDNDLLFVKKFTVSEWADDEITNEEIQLDGAEMKSVFFNTPRTSKASWDNDSKSLKISTQSKMNRGGQTTEINSSETWSLQDGGRVLKIVQTSTGFRGGANTTSLIFEKQ
jgi:mannan endo-1,4-beta-mannosidase